MIETDNRNRGQGKTGKTRGSLLPRLSAAAVLLLAATAPAAFATSYAYGSCAEIPSQELAQGTLDDPNYSNLGPDEDELNLDPDGDGIACDDPGNLVGGEAPEEPVEPPAETTQPETPTQYEQPETPAQADLACANLSQAKAQATFDADPSDPNGLDADADGVACESTGSPTDGIIFEDGTGFIEQSASPPEAASPDAEIAPVTPPPGADSPVFQPAEPDVAAVPDVAGPQNEAPEPDAEVAPVAPSSGADRPVFQPAEPDVTAPPEAPGPGAEVAPVTQPSGADTTVSRPDVAAPTAGRTQRPSAPVSSAPRTPASIRELPATGGSDLPLPVSAGGALLMGLGALMLAAQRRRS